MTTQILNKLVIVVVASLALSFIACDKNQIFDKFETTNGSWKKSDIKKFTFEQKDTVNPYNLFINIRNNSDYPYNNLFLIVKMSDSKGKTIVDTLQYQMANPDGSLLGNGFTDFKESKLFYRENFKFNKPGSYTVAIEYATRENGKIKGDSILPGVSDVGFRIENIN